MFSVRSKITLAVLRFFFVNPQKEAYINELARQLDLDSGNLTRKLIELEKEGILKSRTQADVRYFALNKSFPLLKEYKSIVLKAVGVEELLRQAFQNISQIHEAYIFGSYAKNAMDNQSDIDLMVIADTDVVDVQKTLVGVERKVGREINPIVMTQNEYQKKIKTDSFLKGIHKSKKVRVI